VLVPPFTCLPCQTDGCSLLLLLLLLLRLLHLLLRLRGLGLAGGMEGICRMRLLAGRKPSAAVLLKHVSHVLRRLHPTGQGVQQSCRCRWPDLPMATV
jgi:hypothetical protein